MELEHRDAHLISLLTQGGNAHPLFLDDGLLVLQLQVPIVHMEYRGSKSVRLPRVGLGRRHLRLAHYRLHVERCRLQPDPVPERRRLQPSPGWDGRWLRFWRGRWRRRRDQAVEHTRRILYRLLSLLVHPIQVIHILLFRLRLPFYVHAVSFFAAHRRLQRPPLLPLPLLPLLPFVVAKFARPRSFSEFMLLRQQHNVQLLSSGLGELDVRDGVQVAAEGRFFRPDEEAAPSARLLSRSEACEHGKKVPFTRDEIDFTGPPRTRKVISDPPRAHPSGAQSGAHARTRR